MLHSFGVVFALFGIFGRGFATVTKSANYIYNSDKKNWADAEKWCQDNYSSHLATICTAAQNEEIRVNIQGNGMSWIGFNDIATEGQWKHTSGDTCSYVKWALGEPNNHLNNEDCAIIYTNGNWADGKCEITYLPFACDRAPVKSENYALITTELGYDAANAKCKDLFGTQLATICTGPDNAEATKLINQQDSVLNVWIGFNDKDSDGTFQWQSGNLCTYTNWKVGEPYKKRFVASTDNNEDCAYMQRNGYGLWQAYDCDTKAHALCDLRKDHASAHAKVADLAKTVDSLSDKLTALQKYVVSIISRVRNAIGLELTTDDNDFISNQNDEEENANANYADKNDNYDYEYGDDYDSYGYDYNNNDYDDDYESQYYDYQSDDYYNY